MYMCENGSSSSLRTFRNVPSVVEPGETAVFAGYEYRYIVRIW